MSPAFTTFGWGKTKMKRPRRKIDATLKAEIVFEALSGQKSVVDLAQQYGVHPNQIYTWKKQLKNYAVFAFDSQTQHIAQLQSKISRGASD
jgi:transposase-like protein